MFQYMCLLRLIFIFITCYMISICTKKRWYNIWLTTIMTKQIIDAIKKRVKLKDILIFDNKFFKNGGLSISYSVPIAPRINAASIDTI